MSARIRSKPQAGDQQYKHIVRTYALYRPGLLLTANMVTSYINCMNGREEAKDYDPRLHDILEETYGTMVYQESVMQILK